MVQFLHQPALKSTSMTPLSATYEKKKKVNDFSFRHVKKIITLPTICLSSAISLTEFI